MGSERGRGLRQEDTALTKIFVGGLAWGTRRDGLRAHFEKFGEVEDAVVITDGITGRSRGYGFVTFNGAEAARKACDDPYPVINGRRANCNLASLGARKSRPYASSLSPHPGPEKWRQRSGPPSGLKFTFNRVAPPSPHIPQSRTWEPRPYPPYQYPAFSQGLFPMNYYNTVRGQQFSTYSRPQHLNYYPLHQHPSHVTPHTMHYRKSVQYPQYPVLYRQLYTPQRSLSSIQEQPLPAAAAEGSREEGQVQHQEELITNSLLIEDDPEETRPKFRS